MPAPLSGFLSSQAYDCVCSQHKTCKYTLINEEDLRKNLQIVVIAAVVALRNIRVRRKWAPDFSKIR
jgi:hypothetical protein